MPEMSTIREFVDAVKSGKTTTTKVLNALFEGNTDGYNGSVIFDDQHMGKEHVLDDAFAPDVAWLRDELQKPGKSDPQLALGNAELSHMNSWDNNEKEELRKALVAAVGSPGQPSRDIHFSWALHDGVKSVTKVVPPDLAGTGDITVTLLSPHKNVGKSAFTFGGIDVKTKP